jgi:hypothetical protein
MRRGGTPDDLNQAVDADDFARAQRQGGQYRGPPQPGHRPRLAIDNDVDRPKQPYLHQERPAALSKSKDKAIKG